MILRVKDIAIIIQTRESDGTQILRAILNALQLEGSESRLVLIWVLIFFSIVSKVIIAIIYFKRQDKHFEQYIRENCTKFLVQMWKLLVLCFVLFGMSGSIGEGSGEQLLQNLANGRLVVLDGYKNGRGKQRLKTQLLIGKNSVYIQHIRSSR